ncbi:potassium-transporting ATPase subunit A [Sphaerospermopsis aphanizomenoides BCCUSP55]|uniref:potassium-transporting ATPase subunit KdpA n=1 Tax=Sphaerospermopsis aphanizomenoides TaxID=459663 RepID=UPI001908B54E|nr:potassium-transporting ATPase subunit KdpA [Sphaerospermopsis aphanizomenoides]MBK1988591.1 potassium-transporting ATPase subunit A [Sphaerospermopsis aphanizomenoides BCCUSP55]
MIEGSIQIALTLVIVLGSTSIFGRYMAQVYQQQSTILDPIFNKIERLIYNLIGISNQQDMTGWQYAKAILYSNIVMGCLIFFILINQAWLPLNPTKIGSMTWDTALHTTISFITNTNQQHYSGETYLSYGSQIWGLGYLMFTSAATGLAVGIAFIRGLTGRPLGNFYVDLIRSITRILLPISIIGAILLMIAGVPETLAAPAVFPTLENPNISQAIARGPVAHFEIIKELGENGGGFFAINSAHPLENPNGFSNLIEIIAMLSIPTSLIYTYGIFANNRKQAWLVYSMVGIIFIIFIIITAIGEYNGNPAINAILGSTQPNLEGKEIRFGWAQSTLFTVSTTATMCGAINSLIDSFMPNGGFVTFANMFLQIIWGGQGTGTAYLFAYLILTVFATGLMVGRTPEFLGRKIEKREVVLASFLILLVHPIAIMIPAAITLAFPEQLAGISNPGFHGFAQVLYEYTSAAANNGSGLEGLGDSQPAPLAIAMGAKPTITALWWNLSTSFSLLAGRYIPIIGLLLLADSISRKPAVPFTTGTLRTDTGLFTSVTAGVIIILGALTFFPVLAFGPIGEAFWIAKGIG